MANDSVATTMKGKVNMGATTTEQFKQKKSFATRKEEAAKSREKYSSMIPVIVEKYENEYNLPSIENSKYLVPQEVTMPVFVNVIRNRMSLEPSREFHLFVNNKNLAKINQTLLDTYEDEKDEDGFLYMTYASISNISN